jgi:aspartyl protease family protein
VTYSRSAGLVALYAYRDELMPIAARVVGELLPGSAMTVEQSTGGLTEVRIRKRLDGHFTAHVEVNGATISMIVDTGASSIVLRPQDAKKAGIDVKSFAYRVPVLTANGRTLAARVRLGCGSHRPARPHQGRRARRRPALDLACSA